MSLYSKIFDQEFTKKLKENCLDTNNYLYKILFDSKDKGLIRERKTLDVCFQVIFDYNLDKSSNYISRLKDVNFRNPDFYRIEQALNELKVAYILKELGFKINFNIDSTKKAGEFEVILGEERFQVEVKTCSPKDDFAFIDNIEKQIKDIIGQNYNDLQFMINIKQIPGKYRQFNKREFEDALKNFINDNKNNFKKDPYFMPFNFIQEYQGETIKIELMIEQKNKNLNNNVNSLARFVKNDAFIRNNLISAREQLPKDDGGIIFIFDKFDSPMHKFDIKNALLGPECIKGWTSSDGKTECIDYHWRDRTKAFYKKGRNTRAKGTIFISERLIFPSWNSGGVFYKNQYAKNPLSNEAFQLLKKYCKKHKQVFGPDYSTLPEFP